MADSWPMANVMAGASAVPMGHAVDLAFVFPTSEHGWHDALTSETRRHIGACLASIEIALRLSLERAADMAPWIAQMPDQLCWPTVRARPSLVSPALLAHMRIRAGVTLLLRQAGRILPGEQEDAMSSLPSIDDPEVGDAVSALALAEAYWSAPGGEAMPMRPDLPVEHVAELVWTAAACIAAAIGRMEDVDTIGWSAFERAGHAFLSDHDEEVGPIAEADKLVRRLGKRADSPEMMAQALGTGRFLLFAALASRQLRLTTAQLLEIFIGGTDEQLAAACRSLGGSSADHRYLLLTLAPARPIGRDSELIRAADLYARMSDAQADGIVSALRMPAPFRARVDHLMRTAMR